jgi:hypothetical protein
MTPEQQKEAIEIIRIYRDVPRNWTIDEFQQFQKCHVDDFLTSVKEPEDRCPTCLSTTKGQEGFFDEEKCSDPWHDQRDDYKPSTEDDMITGWDW